MEAIQRLAVADQDELLRRMRQRVEACLGKVMAAVNSARDGHLIDDSEVAANDLLNELKREVYEQALQARVDATEASFSPGERRDGSSATRQGRLGHRLRPDRVDVQGPDATGQRPRQTLEQRQRRSHDGLGSTAAKPTLAAVVDPPTTTRGLAPKVLPDPRGDRMDYPSAFRGEVRVQTQIVHSRSVRRSR